MREADRAAGETNGRQLVPEWLRDTVAGVWRATDWARWEQRVVPELEARGVSVDLLHPLYGTEEELRGIGVHAPGIGWRVGWLGDHPRQRRLAVLQAMSELLRALDAPIGQPRSPEPWGYGGWLHGR